MPATASAAASGRRRQRHAPMSGRQMCRTALRVLLTFFVPLATAQTPVIDGREIFLNRAKGNCIACHSVPGDSSILPKSRIGPALLDVKKRYTAAANLRLDIRDMRARNPDTTMPPYGPYRILSDAEIEAVARYVETL